MVKTANRLRFPLLAGSSFPVTWRLPEVDIPLDSNIAARIHCASEALTLGLRHVGSARQQEGDWQVFFFFCHCVVRQAAPRRQVSGSPHSRSPGCTSHLLATLNGEANRGSVRLGSSMATRKS